MKIKNNLLVLTFLMFVIVSNAQTLSVKAGFNLSNQSYKNETLNYAKIQEFKGLPGGQIGATIDLEIIKKTVSVEAGVMLSSKGYRRTQTISPDPFIQKSYFVYADLPVHVKYHYEMNKIKFYGLAGAYFGFGLKGKQYTKSTIATVTLKSDIDYKFGKDVSEYYLKRFDWGIDIGAGIGLGNFTLQTTYGIGMRNIATYEGLINKNRVFSVTLGMSLGNNNKIISFD